MSEKVGQVSSPLPPPCSPVSLSVLGANIPLGQTLICLALLTSGLGLPGLAN